MKAAERAQIRLLEASDSLRFLIFGTWEPSQNKEVSYDQKCGTYGEVMQLCKLWLELDEDGSGDVEFDEFLRFFNHNPVDEFLGMRCVNYLVGKAKAAGNEAQEGCTIVDMMKLIWLQAMDDDIDKMMQWFIEAEYERDRLPPPPLLPKKKRREILECFPAIKEQESDEPLTFHDLLETSLIDEWALRDMLKKHHVAVTDRATEQRLLEMFCPNGYRAHKDLKSCIDGQGRPVSWVSNEFYTGWLLDGKPVWQREGQGHFVCK